ncbi:MAG: major facilitator superfamily protein [Betaproteobacteria bacterium]|nr:major facilitator superfamily protein [Betaproteobacteria bacterium]
MDKSKKNVALLCACQALLLVNNSVLITVNALAGYALATNKSLATLPVTAYFLGSALAAFPVSMLMKRYGRRAGFSAGAGCGMTGALVCATAVYIQSFWLLCAGTLVLGAYFASGQFYRFAAAETVAPSYKARAISLVLAGGIVGGFVGPETSKLTRAIIEGHLYAGPYFSLVGFALLTILVVRWLDIPPLSAADSQGEGRPIGVIARQPAFIVAVLCGVVSYGVMNLLMTATPLAMVACEHPFSAAAFVIQWHLVAMFAPSFVTGSIIKRIGLLPVMIIGAALMGICVVVAISGIDVMHFWIALVLLGVGWNFMYLGATTLLTETHTPAERGKVQGANDTAISSTMVLSSLSVGALFTYQGWQVMNVLAAPFIAVAAMALVWLAVSRRGRGAVL